jgi:urease accessory protein
MKLSIAVTAALLASPGTAYAGAEAQASFLSGLAHPMAGADHVLAMLAVGFWAATLGGRALWAVPAAFVALMAAGFGLALAGLVLPLVQPAILASVVILGLCVALAVRLPGGAAVALAAAFALFHGHAHGAEFGMAAVLPYLAGFMLATAALLCAGLLAAVMLARLGAGLATRTAGGAVALAGAALVFAG